MTVLMVANSFNGAFALEGYFLRYEHINCGQPEKLSFGASKVGLSFAIFARTKSGPALEGTLETLHMSVAEALRN